MSETIRFMATVEVGPNPNSNSWQVFEISPNAFEDQGIFEEEFGEIEQLFDDLEEEGWNDSGGPIARQIKSALLDLFTRTGENGKLPRQQNLTYALPGEDNDVEVSVIPRNSLEDC